MSARADTSDPAAVRRRQLLLFSVVAAILLVVLAAWLGMGGGKSSEQQSGIEAEIAGPDAAEKVWTRRSEARLAGSRRRSASSDRKRGRSAPTTSGCAPGWRPTRRTRAASSTVRRRSSTS